MPGKEVPAARSPPPTGRTTGRQPYGQHQCTESRALADYLARGHRAVQPRSPGRRGEDAAPRQDPAAQASVRDRVIPVERIILAVVFVLAAALAVAYVYDA